MRVQPSTSLENSSRKNGSGGLVTVSTGQGEMSEQSSSHFG